MEYILLSHEIEILDNIRRLAERGVNRGIDSENGELLDMCSHFLNLLEQINFNRRNGTVTQLAE